MTGISRKEFLKLSAGAAVAATATAVPAAPRSIRPTLIKGADLLTMDPALGEMRGADVLIRDDRIVRVAPSITAPDADVIDARGMILMPGMIDGHRHVWQGLASGQLVKTNPRQYATYQTEKKRVMVAMTAEDHYLAAYLGGLQAIDSGVTSVLDFAHVQFTEDRALASAQGLKDSGIAGWFAYQVSHSPSYRLGERVSLARSEAEQAALSDDGHFRIVEALQAKVFSDSSAPLQLGIAMSVGAFGSPMPLVKAELDRIRATGVGMISTHSHRPAKAFPAGHFGARDSGIADLDAMGLLGPDLHLAHGNGLTREELALLAATGGMVTATVVGEFPYAARKLVGSIHARARAAGVAAGIGIDVGLALTQDYFEHVRGAFWNLYMNPADIVLAETFHSTDVLDFATRSGAGSIRLGDVAGSIGEGRRADVILLRTDRIGFGIMGGLADRVVNFASLADIHSVWVAGRLRKSGGTMLGVDWSALKRRQIAAAARIEADARTIVFE